MTTFSGNICTDSAATFGAYTWVQSDKVDDGSAIAEADVDVYVGAALGNTWNAQMRLINQAFNGTQAINALDVTNDVTVGDLLTVGGNATFGSTAGGHVVQVFKNPGAQAFLYWQYDDATTATARHKRIRYDGSEDWHLEHYDGSAWVTALTINNNGLPQMPVYTDATRPAAGTQGQFFFNSDDGQMNVDDGTNWTLPDGTTT